MKQAAKIHKYLASKNETDNSYLVQCNGVFDARSRG
jgi:hypothetical protein